MSTSNRFVGVVSVLSMLALAGTTLAQGAASGGSFDKPLTVRRAAPAAQPGGTSSTTMIKSVQGDDTYEVSIVDGQVTAKINGKKVPEDRVRQGGSKIELLDKDGEVVHTFNVAVAAGGHGGMNLFPHGDVKAFSRGGEFRAFSPDQFRLFTPGAVSVEGMEPPKVMLGVTMNDVTEEGENDGEEVQHIVIERVIEGLPAGKAGMKSGDVVIAVNGKAANAEKLRAILREKKPGDTITLRIKREDSEKSVKIELQEYDAEKLGNTMNIAPMDAAGAWGASATEAQKRMAEAYREAMKNQPHRFHGEVLGVQPHQMQWFAVPGQAPENRVGELSERLDKLDARLADLDKRLDRLAQTLEKLSDRENR